MICYENKIECLEFTLEETTRVNLREETCIFYTRKLNERTKRVINEEWQMILQTMLKANIKYY